jgi:hypothetical protein
MSVVVANAPREVTTASVSVSNEDGQFVPLAKQTCAPFTNKLVVETVVAYTFVVVTLVNVAFVPMTFCKSVPPKTVSVDVTVDEAETDPPNRLSVLVAVFPRAETSANVCVADAKPLAG